jgi:hypothetical protein
MSGCTTGARPSAIRCGPPARSRGYRRSYPPAAGGGPDRKTLRAPRFRRFPAADGAEVPTSHNGDYAVLKQEGGPARTARGIGVRVVKHLAPPPARR